MDDIGRVREQLEAARGRGLAFEDAWGAALPPPLPPAPRPPNREPATISDQEVTRRALLATEGAWRSAYERRPVLRSVAAAGRLRPS